MQISLDTLVEIIVRAVLRELSRNGIAVDVPSDVRAPALNGRQHATASVRRHGTSLEIDMTGYRTPVLTENHVRAAERHVREIVVPAGTVCTAGARDALQQRNLTLTYISKKP